MKDKKQVRADKKAVKTAKKQIEVIDMGGAKTVKKKTSVITRAKWIFAIVSIIWLAFVAYAPLYVKNTYSGPIKKSIVVSMFFDLQRSIVEQYEKLLDGIKKSINLEKPIAVAIDGVKMVGSGVDKVTDTTAKAKDTTAKATDATTKAKENNEKAKQLSGFVGKFGVKTDGLDKVIDNSDKAIGQVDKGIGQANQAIGKVDDVAAQVNAQLDKVERELTKVAQTEIDKMIDEAIKSQLDKNSGGLGTTLLTNYGIKHVYPWRPSSWPVAVKIYNDLEKSDVAVVNIITGTVNKYFGYVAWGLVGAAWLLGLIIWFMIRKKYKAVIAPFIVCPRCGHTFMTKRSALGILKIFQPWKWI
ncbi:hypothetical protein LJC18_02450 [Lachnospiraceae bacterium OttesenSCG-928-E19]|nr:hypothetical protein [Lachnospiraceae bacterium OttesenSCG-928-E19]